MWNGEIPLFHWTTQKYSLHGRAILELIFLTTKPIGYFLVHLPPELSRASDTADFFLGISSLVASFTPHSPDSPATPLMVLCLSHYPSSSHFLKRPNIMTLAPLSSYFATYLNNLLTFETLTLWKRQPPCPLLPHSTANKNVTGTLNLGYAKPTYIPPKPTTFSVLAKHVLIYLSWKA